MCETIIINRMCIVAAEVEGYGPYKPVPPPKPLSAAPSCHSPPPYRMPPYPLYSEPSIPGAAGIEPPHNNLHTHSSKFPVSTLVPILPTFSKFGGKNIKT